MAPAPNSSNMLTLYNQLLQGSALELKYYQSTHQIDILAKEEDIRRLRFDIHCLEDDNDELRDLLAQEEERSDAFEKLIDETTERLQDMDASLLSMETKLRETEQELFGLQAEREAWVKTTKNVTAAVVEKLALTRELSALKPELEHLKAEAAHTESLIKEKLELQRQVTTLQCELENAKRDTQRALAKRRNTGVEIAQEEQMEDLRRQLAKEKRARQRAEEAADATQADMNLDDVRKELAKEKRARQKAEEKLEEAEQATQVEDVRRDLLREKKAKKQLEDALDEARAELENEKKAAARAAKRADGNAEADDQAEELRQQLASEKKQRLKAEKAAQKAADEFEAQKATLDDKLDQFRTKVRSTKERLQEAEAELAALKAAGPANKGAAAPTSKAARNSKKRNAAQLDPDATTLGTPGDGGPAAKRGRKAAAGVGDKSTFSITPFLNKTMSVAPESDEEGEAEEEADASPAPTHKTKKQPLAVQAAGKANVQPKKAPASRKPKAAPALEMVTEEAEDVHSQGQENAQPAAAGKTMKVKTKTGDEPAGKSAWNQKAKKRKSIHEFATFAAEPDQVKKQKSRKLGGLGKTLFDEEDNEGATTGRSLFGTKGFGALGGMKNGSSFLSGSLKAGSTLLTAGDGSGFQFSPLKRSRKNLDDTLRG